MTERDSTAWSGAAGSEPLRVGYVLTQDRGGPVDVTVALAAALDRLPGYQVRLFGPPPARGAESVAHLLTPIRVGGKGSVAGILAARRAILAWNPHVVHAQDRRSGLVCAGLGRGRIGRAGRSARPALVHTYHGVPDDVSQAWFTDPAAPAPSRYTRAVLRADALVARAVDRTVVVAPSMRAFLLDRLGVPPQRVVHLDNGVDLPPARCSDRSDDCGRRGYRGTRRLLFVGLLIERKGVHLLLDALARADLPDEVTLTVAGDGPQRAALQAQARDLGLAAQVSFLGFRTDVPALLADADAFVLPSVMEQQPLVLIEALGAGLPVLATQVGGVGDLVGDAGLLVPGGNVEALARGLEQLVAADGAALGRRGAARARERHSVQASLARHLDLYMSLSGWRPAPNGRYGRSDGDDPQR